MQYLHVVFIIVLQVILAETYFQEKRPFFLKDSDIFKTPIESIIPVGLVKIIGAPG